MGQVVLLVVAAAWAAVLLPPLLRSRLENRPNSSVLDFRNQLSSLQRAVPGAWRRGPFDGAFAGAVDAQPPGGDRPARHPQRRAGQRAWSAHGSRPRRRPPARLARDARMQEATLRPRQHGAADPQMAAALASSRAAEAKRRRANVLFLLVLTTVCAGFLAATTDSKAMVYLFAVSMVALGGYVYLLVTINQQQFGERAELAVRADAADSNERRRAGVRPPATTTTTRPASTGSRQPARQAAPRQRPMQYPPEAYEALPGSGESGLISYGRGAVAAGPPGPPRPVRSRGLRMGQRHPRDDAPGTGPQRPSRHRSGPSAAVPATGTVGLLLANRLSSAAGTLASPSGL